jgi:hypothetical protein
MEVSGQCHASAVLGGWVGLIAGLNTEARRNPLPLLWIEPRSPGRPVCSHTLY